MPTPSSVVRMSPKKHHPPAPAKAWIPLDDDPVSRFNQANGIADPAEAPVHPFPTSTPTTADGCVGYVHF